MATEVTTPWRVRVTVRGDFAGDYEHETFERARQMADSREAKFGVLGCRYEVIAPKNECRRCGKPGDYVRTRHFETATADVWECRTEGCANHGLIWHTDNPK